MSAFAEAVSRIVGALAPGEIVSYGEVAAEAGVPGAARAVGRVLRHTDGLPWWRVVTAEGRLVPGLEAEHARLLAAEGVTVRGNRIAGGRRWVGRDRTTDQETETVEPDPVPPPDPQDRDVAEQAAAGEQSIVTTPEGDAPARKHVTGDRLSEDVDAADYAD